MKQKSKCCHQKSPNIIYCTCLVIANIFLCALCFITLLLQWYSFSKSSRKKTKGHITLSKKIAYSVGKVSIIIPLKNEAKYIGKTLRNIESSTVDKTRVEVILVDSGSKDNFIDVVKSSTALIPVIQCKQDPHHGKGSSFNSGAKFATGDILLFINADSLLPPGYDETIRRELLDSSVLMACFKISYENLDLKGNFLLSSLRVRAMYENLKSRLCFLPTIAQGYAITASNFVGNSFPDSFIFDDIDFVCTLRSKMLDNNESIVTMEASVMNSSDRIVEFGVVKETFVQILSDILHYWFNVSEETIIKWLYIRYPYYTKWFRV